MRIRDWSSDVCSSDRGAIEIGGGGAGVAVIGRGRATDLAEIGAAVLVRAQIARPARHILARQLAQPIDIGGQALEIGIERGLENGRASFRERSGQYVSVLVVAVHLKTKNKTTV